MSSDEAAARGERPGGDIVPTPHSGPRRGQREMWVEVPAEDGAPAAWCYSDRRAYRAGETVTLHLSASVPAIVLRIFRDGAARDLVHASGVLPARFHPAPERAYERGCFWPPFAQWPIPADLPSGGYLIEIADAAGGAVLGHHLVIVRAAARREDTIALVAATSTWAAYNDWGGANHYYGLNAGAPRGRSPILSSERPWARGQVWLPQGAPRCVNAQRPEGPGPARYDFVEWAFANGAAKYYALAGWASYERPFAAWLERQGYAVDILTQDEVHADAAALDPYRCALFVGHDEYWSREMRGTVDNWVERGGRAARFAGNFLWQIRLEEGTRRQIAYKYDARSLDPVAGTAESGRLTSAWDDPLVGYPGAQTFGVNALQGIYAAFGGMAARSPRGFTVFRPEHWAFAGTGLGYADMFGDEASIFGYEMDGLDYAFEDGLPVPTGRDGAPPGVEILAMGWATLAEYGRPEVLYSHMLGDGDARFRASLLGDPSAASIAKHSRGAGMVVGLRRGRGEVFTAGTCEWVNGLIRGDVYTEAVTRNVLDRFRAAR